MANSDKNIVITPNIGHASNNPVITFSGADSSTGPQNISLYAYPTNNGTLSFEGSAGQLFSINNLLTGTLFSVNDVSGIPSIEVLDTGLVKLGQYSGNILLGTASDNATDKLQVAGSISATGGVKGSQLTSTVATGTAPIVVTSTTMVNNLNANYWGGNAFSSYLNQAVRTGDSVTFNDLYVNSWFRNNNSGQGMYNQATTQHFYSDDDDYWNVAGGTSANAIRFRDEHGGTIRGYIYADSSNQVGLLNNNGAWLLRGDSSNNVQIYGTTLTVGSSTSSYITMTDTDNTTRQIHCNSNLIGFLTSGGSWGSYCDNSGNWTSAGNITAYSDIRLKTNIKVIDNALSKVLKLRGITYDRTDSSLARQTGVIAQEVLTVLPEAVIGSESTQYSVAYGNMVGLLIEAIKEQQSIIADQKEKLQLLLAKVEKFINMEQQ